MEKRLGDICNVLMCKRVLAEQTSEIEEIPFYKIGTLGNTPDAFISRSLFEKYKNRYNYPRKGEVLITCSGTIGKCLTFDGQDAYYQDSNIVWLDNSSLKVKNDFLFYVTHNIDWVKLNSTTITRIYGADLRNVIVRYPFNHLEQDKIVSFVSLIDERITTQRKIISQLKTLMKSLRENVFASKIRFKKINSDNFPDWSMKRLGDVTYNINKNNKHSEALPIYSISNINGFVPQSQQFDGLDSSSRGYNISLYKVVEGKTFVYNPARINVGSIAYSGIIKKVIVSSLYVCFRTIDIVNDCFLYHFLQTNHFKKSVVNNGEGGVRIYLFYENFSNINIHLPCYEEQSIIANCLSVVENKIKMEEDLLEKYQSQKKIFMEKMFT